MSVLFAQGLELLLYGMGTVVLFLALLVVATRMMSRVVLAFFPESEPMAAARAGAAQTVAEQPPALAPVPAAMDPSPELLAVITAAVHLHRKRRGGSAASDG